MEKWQESIVRVDEQLKNVDLPQMQTDIAVTKDRVETSMKNMDKHIGDGRYWRGIIAIIAGGLLVGMIAGFIAHGRIQEKVIHNEKDIVKIEKIITGE